MPIGIKGFQKGHAVFPGAEKGWFPVGIIPIGGLATRFKKGHSSYFRDENWRGKMSETKRGKPAPSWGRTL